MVISFNLSSPNHRLEDEEGFVLVFAFNLVVEEALCPFAFNNRFFFTSFKSSCKAQPSCRIAANQRVAREVAAKFSWSPDSWPQFIMEIASAAQVLLLSVNQSSNSGTLRHTV